MTISNTTVEQIYQGNASQTTFAVPFALQANTEIEVTLRDETDPDSPVITLQVLTTHYSLTGGPPATNVVMNSAPTSNQKLLIRRVTAKTQTADYIANGPFPADQHESTLDKIVQQVQELSNNFRRVPALNKTVPLTSIDPSLPQPVAGGLWAWDVNGELVEFIDPATLLGVLGGFSDPMTSRGDIIIRDGTNNTARLGIGSAGQVLSSDGTDISWSTPTVYVGSVTAVGSSPNANSATVTAGVLNLEPADSTNPGVMTALSQTFGGAKTFSAALIAAAAFSAQISSADSATTGTDASIPLPANTGIRLTNASLASVNNLVAGANGRILVLVNDTTGSVVIKNDTGGTAANRILTGTGANLTLANGAALLLYYDTQNSRWRIIGGSGSSGGSGDVVGPASGTDNAVVRFDSTTGKLVQNSSFIVSDSGTVSASGYTAGVLHSDGSGAVTSSAVVTADITDANITNAKLADMAQSTIKGRAAGAGTGVPVDLTATQATAILNVFGPDSGAGGVKGLVPATVAGDATKILYGDGTWKTPASGFADPLTTKGDLIVHTTVTTRLGIGSDGDVLTADAASAAGLKWATPASGFADPMTTRGDIIIRNSSNTTARLAHGANHTFLKSDGTDVAYASIDLAADVSTTILPLANGGTGAALVAANGAIPYSTGTVMALLAAGTTGQVLTSGGAAAPTWGDGARPKIFGSRGTPRSVVAATGITSGATHMSTTAIQQDIYAEGSVAGDNLVATITAGTIDGQRMTVIGRNDSNLLIFDDTTTNCAVRGSATLGAGMTIDFRWDGTSWHETNRSVG